MEPTVHKVQYYETDKMGLTHHSNYIRFMEEARVDFLEKAGWGYDKMEEMGLISPVRSLNVDYKSSTTYPDVILIRPFVQQIKGAVVKIGYEMTRESDGALVCRAESEHCFLSTEGRIVRLKKDFPELYEFFAQLEAEHQAETAEK